jgi:hypothetical protein
MHKGRVKRAGICGKRSWWVFWIVLVFLLAVPVAEAGPNMIVNFSAKKPYGPMPLNVEFGDLSTNNPAGWAWYFGDETYRNPWTLVSAGSGWTPRVSLSSAATPDGSIVLMGGQSNTVPSLNNDTWRSADYGRTWTRVNASSGWTRRSQQTSVTMPDGSIILMGGLDLLPVGPSLYANDVWRTKDRGTTWTRVNASAGWSERGGHSSVAMPDGSIVLTGGYAGGSHDLNDTWRSTDYGKTWTLMNASSGWSGRIAHSTIAMPGGGILLTGGHSDDLPVLNNDTWRSNDYGRTWTLVNASSGWAGRSGHTSAAMPDGSIILMGGGEGLGINASYNDLWRSTTYGRYWTLVNASSGWSGREGHSSVAMPDSSIVLMGGSMHNDTWRFVPAGSTLQNPTHTYTGVGKYNVALQAHNNNQYNSTLKFGYVTVTLPLTKSSTPGRFTLPALIPVT